MPRSHGVTMIELLIVLVVLGVLAAVVGPSFRGMMVRQRVQGVHDQLVTDLQLARSELAARANATAPTDVAVTFGGNAALSCYTIHTAGAACDCTAAPGSACAPGAQEIRTVQIQRAQGISLAASSTSGTVLRFQPPQGTITPTDLTVTVSGDPSGQLRTQLSVVGRPSVCSPDGSMKGVPTC
ncbi:MAG: prepilin-type N-terminal cleavage/methylation domain-containing protein [Burkholderiaceae bacterium]|nr:prepilin-type N-terminal cleavage/methylation domain-containing protein [Burkholderiaceae bacterium]